MHTVIALAAAPAFAAGAFAQSNPDMDSCAGTSGTADQRIAACTRTITSGKLSTQDLAVSFYNRGMNWSDQGDYDRAIADYSEAIRLNPRYALAHNNRGVAWSDKREYDRAIADYSEAIRLNRSLCLPTTTAATRGVTNASTITR